MPPLRPCVALFLIAGWTGSAPGAPPATEARAVTNPSATPAHDPALLAALRTAQGRFTPQVRDAALAAAKADALRELAAAGITLPAEFLAAVDARPLTAVSVYGGVRPAGALVILRSLEIDLGADAVRGRLAQLALAVAACHAQDIRPATLDRPGLDPEAATPHGFSLRARPPLRLVIPPCPLRPVDTNPKDRPRDLNDDIINFFTGRTLEIEERTGTKVENGKKIPVLTRRTVPLAACHVMASAERQREFNAHLKACGRTVAIDCGDGVIHPDRRDAFDRKDPQSKRILEAFALFKTAYEAKGLLPAAREPAATPAEWIAFLARNHDTPLAPGVKAAWPLFPLDAPWPAMVMLIQTRQPLREADDLWTRYRDRGEFRRYGEYIGGIAQQYDFQSARRLAPFPFAYGSVQMMFKDGGVCGTMANIAARGYVALGVPASTAGQPGHCALVYQELDPKTGRLTLKGAQFVTGGPDKTTPHTDWIFGDAPARRSMVYAQSTVWAVNRDFAGFLDCQMARRLANRLPASEHPLRDTLLRDATERNPWNLAAFEARVTAEADPVALMAACRDLLARLAASAGPGHPDDPLYRAAATRLVHDRLAVLPVPADREVALALLAELERDGCAHGAAWLKYRSLTGDLDTLRSDLGETLRRAVAEGRTPAGCELLAGRLKVVADATKDRETRRAWATRLYAHLAGRETYLPAGARKNAKPQPDPCAALLCHYAGKTAEALALEAARAQALAERAGRDLAKPPAR